MQVQAESVYSQHSKEYGGRTLPGVLITDGPPNKRVSLKIHHATGACILSQAVELDENGEGQATLVHVPGPNVPAKWTKGETSTFSATCGSQRLPFRLNGSPQEQESFSFALVNEKTHQRYLKAARTALGAGRSLPSHVNKLLNNAHAFVPRLAEAAGRSCRPPRSARAAAAAAAGAAAHTSAPDASESASPEDDADDDDDDDDHDHDNGSGEMPAKRAKQMKREMSRPALSTKQQQQPPSVEAQPKEEAEEEMVVVDDDNEVDKEQAEEEEKSLQEDQDLVCLPGYMVEGAEATTEAIGGAIEHRQWMEASPVDYCNVSPPHSQEPDLFDQEPWSQGLVGDSTALSGSQDPFGESQWSLAPSPPSPRTSSMHEYILQAEQPAPVASATAATTNATTATTATAATSSTTTTTATGAATSAVAAPAVFPSTEAQQGQDLGQEQPPQSLPDLQLRGLPPSPTGFDMLGPMADSDSTEWFDLTMFIHNWPN